MLLTSKPFKRVFPGPADGRYLNPLLQVFFFFQAEDGIRDLYVTGVQTCALPIWPLISAPGCAAAEPAWRLRCASQGIAGQAAQPLYVRSEERRVGKECRSRW